MAVKRIEELDFLKCVLILSVVTMHLVYIEQRFPYMKEVIGMYQASCFFLISGYFASIRKPSAAFGRSMLWLFVPYVVMETAYIFASYVLPVREGASSVAPMAVLRYLFAAPVGPYWYLHTLLLCTISYYIVWRLPAAPFTRLLALGFCFYGLSEGCGLMLFANTLYFLAGVAIRESRLPFTFFFPASWWAVVPFVVLCSFPENLWRGTLAGAAISGLLFCFLLAVYRRLPHAVARMANYIGRHTLVILLFSPLFTFAVKPMGGWFSFDPTGLLFWLLALAVNVAGCFFVSWCLDALHLSRWLFGKKRVMEPFSKDADGVVVR